MKTRTCGGVLPQHHYVMRLWTTREEAQCSAVGSSRTVGARSWSGSESDDLETDMLKA